MCKHAGRHTGSLALELKCLPISDYRLGAACSQHLFCQGRTTVLDSSQYGVNFTCARAVQRVPDQGIPDTSWCRTPTEQSTLHPAQANNVIQTFLGGTTSDQDFRLSVLATEHEDFKSLQKQFMTQWLKKSTGTGLSVERIFRVEVRRCSS